MSLTTINPIDGRYSEDTKELRPYFSEFGLIRYKLILEVEYLLALNKTIKSNKQISEEETRQVKNIYLNFSLEEAKQIKIIEKSTNHDTKAIEYYIKEKLEKLNLIELQSFVHFALTSDDVNNLAYRLMWQESVHKIYLPKITELVGTLKTLAEKYANTPLLSLTHGQPATPTTIGKEFNVYVHRLNRQIIQLQNHKLTGKLNGATGTFSAHQITYPEIDWPKFSTQFIRLFGLEANLLTTQIEPADSLTESYQNIFRINSILTDFCRDMWYYVSRGIFNQQKKSEEIGSSTMPHKINPIQFENAEGNLGLANSYLIHLSSTLPISRLQRDLSGSTVIRNQGVPLAHSYLAIKQVINGLSRINVNQEKINLELNEHWEVLTEAIQTILRKLARPDAYEKIKDLTRGEKLNEASYKNIVNALNLPAKEKEQLLNLTPQNYLGLAEQLAKA